MTLIASGSASVTRHDGWISYSHWACFRCDEKVARQSVSRVLLTAEKHAELAAGRLPVCVVSR
jgi:hypothetical protein